MPVTFTSSCYLTFANLHYFKTYTKRAMLSDLQIYSRIYTFVVLVTFLGIELNDKSHSLTITMSLVFRVTSSTNILVSDLYT